MFREHLDKSTAGPLGATSLLIFCQFFRGVNVNQVEGRHLSNSEQGILLHQMRHRLSVAIIKAQSSCLLSRLGHFSPGAKEAAKRVASAKHRDELKQQDQRALYLAHIHGRRIHEQLGTLWI